MHWGLVSIWWAVETLALRGEVGEGLKELMFGLKGSSALTLGVMDQEGAGAEVQLAMQLGMGDRCRRRF